jgi:hypothetical protein
MIARAYEKVNLQNFQQYYSKKHANHESLTPIESAPILIPPDKRFCRTPAALARTDGGEPNQDPSGVSIGNFWPSILLYLPGGLE